MGTLYAAPKATRTANIEAVDQQSTHHISNIATSNATLNIFGSELSPTQIASNVIELLLRCSAPVVISIAAWVLLFFGFSFLVVPHDSTQRSPSLKDRLRFCKLPTSALGTIQLGMAFVLPAPVIDYGVKLQGRQEDREVSLLSILAFKSWLATVAITTTVLIVLAVFVSVNDWVKDIKGKRSLGSRIEVGWQHRGGQ